MLQTMASVFYLRTLATFAREATIVTPFMMQLNSSVKNAFVLAKWNRVTAMFWYLHKQHKVVKSKMACPLAQIIE